MWYATSASTTASTANASVHRLELEGDRLRLGRLADWAKARHIRSASGERSIGGCAVMESRVPPNTTRRPSATWSPTPLGGCNDHRAWSTDVELALRSEQR